MTPTIPPFVRAEGCCRLLSTSSWGAAVTSNVRSGLALAIIGGMAAVVGLAGVEFLLPLGIVAALFGAVYVVYGLLND